MTGFSLPLGANGCQKLAFWVPKGIQKVTKNALESFFRSGSREGPKVASGAFLAALGGDLGKMFEVF